jgi:azurin
MKILRTTLVLSSWVMLAGCGRTDSPSLAAVANGLRTFEITANDTMRYSVTRLEASVGEDVKVVLTNTGTQPKQVMGHNWVLLKQGSDPAAFANAALSAASTEYYPEQLAGEVIAHIRLLGPRESGEVKFKAPAKPGEYPFLCTFPAHFLTGMHGILVVR